jgi:hypothetical protein
VTHPGARAVSVSSRRVRSLEQVAGVQKRDPPLGSKNTAYWLLAIGYWLLAIGYWLLAIGCWLLAVGCWLLAVGYWLLAIGYLRSNGAGALR